MTDTENPSPAPSVTALRIPIIKKGEYDLWCMKIQQYIAITDNILWDIIINGAMPTTEPTGTLKSSTSNYSKRCNDKALNVLLSTIPDRHLLSFHDSKDAKSLWIALKTKFGGNAASKKMQRNLLKRQFETFTIDSREVIFYLRDYFL